MPANMSCARVQQYKSSDIGKAERHNERKNESYGNLNVVPERIHMNVHFKDTGGKSYMDVLHEMEADGKVSTRGLRQDATLFDEIVVDVNTMYFENHGGYEYAKRFYEEAFHFIEEKFGPEYVISAVMHADELNKAATDDLGRETYHYHMHAVVLPVVDKEILWTKRCKDPELVGKVKEVIHQISHSKKWASDVPMTNENGEPVLRANGKPKYRPSYSILQDEFYNHMREHGFHGFERGQLGSTTEHLTSLEYQIEKDKERIRNIEQETERVEVKYFSALNVVKTYSDIDYMGSKTLTGKIAMSPENYNQLTALAKEGISSRAEISRLNDKISEYHRANNKIYDSYNRLKNKYDELLEKCEPFLSAMEHFPEAVKAFTEKVKGLFASKEAEKEKARAEAQAAYEKEILGRKSKKKDREWER